MKRYFFLLSFVILGFSSCKKTSTDNTAAQAAIDDAAIQTYITTNNIPAVKDPSGLYYQILTPGTGAHPTSTSNITTGYTGDLLDGTFIDTQASIYSAMSSHGKGWQIGMSKIGTGGKILLIIPSGLAYGTVGFGSVPANAVLVYTVTLQGFNN